MSRLASGLALGIIAAAPGIAAAGETGPAAFVKPDMIGAEVKWFEAQIGPAFRIDGDYRTYRLDGCEFGVEAAGDKIAGFQMPVSPECAFNLAAFMPNADAVPPLDAMTFAAFDAAVGGLAIFQADCLKLCGNAFDPSVYAAWQGGRADNLMTVTLGARQVDDATIDAALAWEKAMEGEDEDYLLDARFNCDGKYNEAARAILKDVKPDTVYLGVASTGISCPAAP